MQIDKIITLNSIDSTNDYIKRENLKGNVCVRAFTQTNGKGRLGRDFLSPEGGLYFSVIFQCENKHLATIGAAVVVAQCIQKSIIKWPNDILLNGKKVCGILCECSNYDDRIIVGIGVNVKTAPLDSSCATGGDPELLFMNLIKKFQEVFTLLDLNPKVILSLYRKQLFLSYEVSALDNPTVFGEVVGIDDNGRLLICTQQGVIHAIMCGEVAIINRGDSLNH